MQAFYNNPEFSDITVILRDPAGHEESILAHRVILAAKSEFFKTMLTSNFREGHQSQIMVEVPTLEMGTQLLTWMYSGDTKVPLELVKLADMWLVVGKRPLRFLFYPGESASFNQNGGSIGLNGKVQTMNYYTFNLKSPIQSFSIWTQPTLELTVYLVGCDQQLHSTHEDMTKFITELRHDFLDYLEMHDITVPAEALTTGHFKLTSPAQVYELLQSIAANNKFSPDDTKFITDIIESITHH